MLARVLALTVLVYGHFAVAQDTTATTVQAAPSASAWKNESELSEVLISGNTDSQSTSLKQKTSFTFSNLNTIVGSGRYLMTQSNGTTTARAWDATGRYERALTNYWSLYTSYGAESDIFAGYIQRDNFDLGAKYYFIKRDNENLIGEVGYRNQHSYLVPGINRTENLGRIFSEYSKKFSKTSEGKIYVEYLPNFTNSKAYQLNAEPSLSAAISSIFSVKMSYLMKYQGVVPAGLREHLDTTYSTALVANW